MIPHSGAAPRPEYTGSLAWDDVSEIIEVQHSLTATEERGFTDLPGLRMRFGFARTL